MIALSFLGTGRYEQTTYALGGRQATTELFTLALPELLGEELSAIHVFETQEARSKHGSTLDRASLPIPLERHAIPSGASEGELWTIFETIVAAVPNDARVAFDITHCFRSVPLLALLAIAHLRVVKNVELRHLLYGAWEARERNENRAPVFDLTPMASLLDWLLAADRFRSSLDASKLSEMLKSIQGNLRRRGASKAPSSLSGIGDLAESFAKSIRVGPIGDVYGKASALAERCDQATLASEADSHAKPLLQILPHLAQTARTIPPRSPASDLAIAKLCLEHGHPSPAIAIIREWLVSRTASSLYPERDPLDYRDTRKPAEDALNEAKDRNRPAESSTDSPPPNISKEIADLWNEVAAIRNEVAHFGYRKNATGSKRVIEKTRVSLRKAEDLAAKLDQIAAPAAEPSEETPFHGPPPDYLRCQHRRRCRQEAPPPGCPPSGKPRPAGAKLRLRMLAGPRAVHRAARGHRIRDRSGPRQRSLLPPRRQLEASRGSRRGETQLRSARPPDHLARTPSNHETPGGFAEAENPGKFAEKLLPRSIARGFSHSRLDPLRGNRASKH